MKLKVLRRACDRTFILIVNLRSSIMKHSYVAALVAVLGLIGAVQTSAQAATSHSAAPSIASSDSLTRAQVYRQLVSAEKHGLLQQGDTVYPKTAMSHEPRMHITRQAVDNRLAQAERHGLLTQPGNAYPVVPVAARKHAVWTPKMQVAGEATIQRLYENP
ncbi:hypothetical protein DBA34_00195 [Pandoraea cepalis]|uniref:DUF4148 domain-containing protein n=1 Tax=Pandoraea cepalis TaxID=2508294 RepID=A0AAW7MG25_9BURK|nr:DUF4148 domain-containing protein [Pandoraea cepalis]MDN4571696.1 hypothetical protein [Pandoraea cepalis]